MTIPSRRNGHSRKTARSLKITAEDSLPWWQGLVFRLVSYR